MTIESNTDPGKKVYDPLEDPRWVHGPIWLAILSILLDRLVTVLFWGYEANPLVDYLGVYNWFLLTFVLISGLLYVWYPMRGVEVTFNRFLVLIVAIAHIFATVSNLAVVVFF